MANKVRFGLKNAHYSVVTMNGTTPSFATPAALPGAVSLSLEPQGDSSDFYADDGDYFSRYANNGYEGTLELAMIPDSFLTDCLGQTTDTDNLIVETSNDQPKHFALLFEFTGDEKGIRHCMYYCTASRPTQAADTSGESLEVKTEELSFKAIPIPGTNTIKAKSTPTTDTARYNSWFTAVALPDFPELTVSPASATFDGSTDVVLTVTGGTVDAIKLGGATVASTNYTVSGSTVTLKHEYLSTLAAGIKRFKLFAGTDNAVVQVTIPAASE